MPAVSTVWDPKRVGPLHITLKTMGSVRNWTQHNLLRTCLSKKQQRWTKCIGEVLFAYNTMENQTTGYSPYFLMFGRSPCLPVDLLLGGKDTGVPIGTTEEWIRNLFRLLIVWQGSNWTMPQRYDANSMESPLMMPAC